MFEMLLAWSSSPKIFKSFLIVLGKATQYFLHKNFNTIFSEIWRHFTPAEIDLKLNLCKSYGILKAKFENVSKCSYSWQMPQENEHDMYMQKR